MMLGAAVRKVLGQPTDPL